MGRDPRNEQRVEHWTKMLRSTMQEPAWRELSPVAQALYPWLKLEWHGENANNNGRIRLSVRQAATRLGVSPNTAAKSYQDFQAKGFIVVREGAQLGTSGAAKSTAFELTELAMPGTREGRKLYQSWKAGANSPVEKMHANNPQGRNGRAKPRLSNDDGTVVNIRTNRK